MCEYDDNYVFIAIDAARELARLGDAVTGLEVRTSSRWVASDVGDRLEQELGSPYRAVDWQEQNSSLFQALKLEARDGRDPRSSSSSWRVQHREQPDDGGGRQDQESASSRRWGCDRLRSSRSSFFRD
jgi:hypothetical protein